jgi:antitoxin MazE
LRTLGWPDEVPSKEASMMVKKLSAVGDGLGLIIERPILDVLDIDEDTPLEVTTDGERLVIRPLRTRPLMDRALAAADRLMDAHEETFRKLAE